MKYLVWLALLSACVRAEHPIHESVSAVDMRLINGKPVEPGTYKEVVRIRTGNSSCTASIIGPKVALTAAHCVNNGSTSAFKLDGKDYKGVATRSPLYPGKDHDIALLLLDKEVEGVEPVNVVKETVKVGEILTILGYGCVQPGGGGGNDGVLRYGEATVTGFSGFSDVVSKNGAALCFGDSGGPAYVADPARKGYRQATVNSKGNISTINYTADLGRAESQDFFKKFAADNSVDICGVTKECGAPPPDQFTMENAAVKITVVSKGVHALDYLKRVFEQVMLFLEGGGETAPMPLPHEE